MTIKRGEIHLASLDPTIGREISKTRPVVIISNNINNRFSGTRRIGSVVLFLILVSDNRLGATGSVKTSEGFPLIYSSRLRTLIDAVYDWSRFNGLPRACGWIRQELKDNPEAEPQLTRLALEYGNKGTVRRLGYLLESEGARPSTLRMLAQAVERSKSLIPWDPTRPKRGRQPGR